MSEHGCIYLALFIFKIRELNSQQLKCLFCASASQQKPSVVLTRFNKPLQGYCSHVSFFYNRNCDCYCWCSLTSVSLIRCPGEVKLHWVYRGTRSFKEKLIMPTQDCVAYILWHRISTINWVKMQYQDVCILSMLQGQTELPVELQWSQVNRSSSPLLSVTTQLLANSCLPSSKRFPSASLFWWWLSRSCSFTHRQSLWRSPWTQFSLYH